MESTTDKVLTFNHLKDYCLEYDRKNGAFPESEFQGMEIYRYIIERYFNAENASILMHDYHKEITGEGEEY